GRPAPRPGGGPSRRGAAVGGARALAGALRLAGVWLSPALLLGPAPLLLADGTQGLWPPLLLAAAAPLAVVLLAAPWARLPAGGQATLLDLVRLPPPPPPAPRPP